MYGCEVHVLQCSGRPGNTHIEKTQQRSIFINSTRKSEIIQAHSFNMSNARSSSQLRIWPITLIFPFWKWLLEHDPILQITRWLPVAAVRHCRRFKFYSELLCAITSTECTGTQPHQTVITYCSFYTSFDVNSRSLDTMRNSTLVTASVSVIGGGIWVGIEGSALLFLATVLVYAAIVAAAKLYQGNMLMLLLSVRQLAIYTRYALQISTSQKL